MRFKGRSELLRTGSIISTFGAILALIGSLGMSGILLSNTSSFYPFWYAVLGIVGSGLIITGIVVMIVGSLRID